MTSLNGGKGKQKLRKCQTIWHKITETPHFFEEGKAKLLQKRAELFGSTCHIPKTGDTSYTSDT